MLATPQDSAARRYRIEKYLTEGGMGAIYIGKKLGPGGFAKEVVLKQLLPEYTSRPEFRDLFFREAKISATLDHANIVHTFDLVESDQSLFIVMEYVRGADLRTIIRRARHRKRELSPAAAIHIALEILAGLSYAHARRDASGKSLDIIHRDVSPSNIICSVEGAAKLSDFGIAKASTYSSVFYRVRGKVGYMSPEQARSQAIDHRCDLFSLSVCLYESLSGERLFVGDLNTPADEIYGIPILPASHKRPGLPRALDDVLMRALAPHVDDRYQNAAELGEALRRVAHRNGLAFSPPELAAHLRDILGDDPERWLRAEPVLVASDPNAVQAPSSDLVGTEASSIGIVSDIPQDEPARSVLNPRGVSGSKDFDLDSMLNDEATRPIGEVRRSPSPPIPTPSGVPPAAAPFSAPPAAVAGPPSEPARPSPAWARSSSPFPLATPKPVETVATRPAPAPPPPSLAPPVALSPPSPAPSSVVVPPPLVRPAASRPNLPGVSPGVAAPRVAISTGMPQGRPPRRATQRIGAIPPPFSPGSRLPPPPPLFVGHDVRYPAPPPDEIEEATPAPRPPVALTPLPQVKSIDIEDISSPAAMADQGGVVGLASSIGPSRSMPPAAYPSLAEQPLVLSQPVTIDFSGAVSALLPEKKGGPRGWLAALLILFSTIAGVSLAHRATRAEVAELTQPSVEQTGITSSSKSEDPAQGVAPPAPTARAAPPPAEGEGPKPETITGGQATAKPAGKVVPQAENADSTARAGDETAAPTTDALARPAGSFREAKLTGKRPGAKHVRKHHPKRRVRD
jgi:serine/threonine protein kinase